MHGFFKTIKNVIKSFNTITIENGICLNLDKKNLTASITKSENAHGDIFIPCSVIYNSKNYVITSIDKNAFKNNHGIKSIRFSEMSSIKTINWHSFSSSSIKSFSFPNNLEKLEMNMHTFHANLKKLKLNADNRHFSYLDDECKLVASNYNENRFELHCFSFKKNETNENIEMDNLFFAKLDIKNAVIPTSIKYIDDYCFENCYNIKKIEFQSPSSVISFGNYAFSNSKIESFEIPSSVHIFKEYWCHNTKNLKNVSVSPQNQWLKTLDNNDFIIVKRENLNQNEYNTILFANRNIKKVIIPSSIEIISSFSFMDCSCIEIFEFENNSKLKEIQNGAFNFSSIKNISIPDSTEIINMSAFSGCNQLKSIRFSEKSKLTSFQENSLLISSIEYLTIPPLIKKINNLISACNNLKFVEFLADEIILNGFWLNSSSILLISFPNTKKIKFMSYFNNLNNAFIYVLHNTVIE